MMRSRCLLLIVLLAGVNAVADLPAHDPRPGGIAVVPAGTGGTPPTVTFDGRQALMLEENGTWYAVVGIPLAHPTGAAELRYDDADGRASPLKFDVQAHSYREQRLEVERSYVEPDAERLERILAERRIIDAALNNYRDTDVATLSLPPPVPGRQSDSFGFRRFFNDQPRSPHSGMDIASPQGTEIKTPVPGIVTATGHYFFNGNTVIVDHGQGFITMYCHLQRIDVEEGQAVQPRRSAWHCGCYRPGHRRTPALRHLPQWNRRGPVAVARERIVSRRP